MKVKCGRRIFNVTNKDLILDNGACYILITQSYHQNWSDCHPNVSKTLFKKLLKDGKIRKSKKKYKTGLSSIPCYDLYEFVESEVYDENRVGN